MKYILCFLVCFYGSLQAQSVTTSRTTTKTNNSISVNENGHSYHYDYDSNNGNCDTQYETKEFKIKHSGGVLKIENAGTVVIETYTGNEVIFATEVEVIDHVHNARSKGLKVLDSEALIDNSQLGFSIQKEGSNLVAKRIISGHCDCEPLYIKLPKGIALEIKDDTHFGEVIEIKNFSEALEIDVTHPAIVLDKVTGPMAIKTLHGSIEATFTSISQVASVSMVAVHDFIDVSIPSNSKVSFDLKTQHGEILSDLDIKIDKSTARNNSWEPKKITGTLNGGGVKMALNSNFSEVYIRKL